MTKTCVKCGENHPLNQFWKDVQKNDGLRPYCKNCERDRYTSKEYYAQRKHPKYAKIKRKHKVKSFGLTMEQYEALILAQGNKCAICGVHQDELNKLLSIDHCHKTKKVRGLLCCKCNFGIGYFKEDVGIMEKAIKYVIQNT